MWRYALMALALLLVAESLLGHRSQRQPKSTPELEPTAPVNA